MLELLKTLCTKNGVSSTEDEVREYIEECVRPYADEIKTDALGNLLVFKKGAKAPTKKLMLAAHMDEVGVMVTSITSEGYLKFGCVGGIDTRVILGKPVYIGANRVFGVIGCKAIHLIPASERKKVPDIKSLYIDIGARSKEEAEKLVSLGDTGAFDPRFFEFGGNIKAKAIDDRIGCAVLIELIKSDLPIDCWFAFTVQEEVGTRGATVAAYNLAPDVALVVEGTTAGDLPSAVGAARVCSPGEGVVIPFMDKGTIYDPALYKMMGKLADDNGIKWQTKTMIAGGTDASAIQRSRAGVKTVGIAAAVRNIHSPSCVCAKADIDGLFKLAQLFIAKIGEEN